MSANTLFLFVSLANLHIVLCPNKMAALTELEAYSESKCFKRWVRKIINDGVEALTRKSKEAEPRMRFE